MKSPRLAVDKLGVKLYDSVSAVIAELVSNSYDADATEVRIEASMGSYLATKAGGQIKDKNLEIRITDNGIGMTPQEVNDYYLVVGSERRHDPRPGRGDKSPRFGRRVMGSKGVGKLAPFGICETVEIVSSGDNPVTRLGADGKPSEGYLTAHLILVRSAMLQDEEFDYQPAPGNLDQTVRPDTGTIIVLKGFGYRRVAAHALFRRQLAQRFGISSRDWTIRTRDTTQMQNDEGYQAVVEPFDIETMSNSRITFTGPERPNFVEDSDRLYQAQDASGHILTEFGSGFHHDGRFYPVTGWTAYAKAPYKDELMAGIRIYCRNKIAAQTTVFGRGAGFPGEYSIRSYLVGEIHADWLDEAEDLIQTDRRDILWSHDLGQEFQRWGRKVVRKIGSLARDPLRQSTWQRFCEAGGVQHKIEEAFPAVDQSAIRVQATSLAKLLAQNLRPSEVEDTAVIEPMIQLTLTMAPHIELDQKLREAANAEETPMAALGQILRMARMAELSSFGRIAEDRLKVIKRVQELKNNPDTAEQRLQALLEYAPWLINPQWTPITANQTFSTLRGEFEKFYRQETSQTLQLGDFAESAKRPDFVLSNQDGALQIVEIKRPGHALTNDEMDRIITYVQVMEQFLDHSGHAEFRRFYRSVYVTLVCDELNLQRAQQISFNALKQDGSLTHIDWGTFLLRTRQMHEDFLQESTRQQRGLAAAPA